MIISVWHDTDQHYTIKHGRWHAKAFIMFVVLVLCVGFGHI